MSETYFSKQLAAGEEIRLITKQHWLILVRETYKAALVFVVLLAAVPGAVSGGSGSSLLARDVPGAAGTIVVTVGGTPQGGSDALGGSDAGGSGGRSLLRRASRSPAHSRRRLMRSP